MRRIRYYIAIWVQIFRSKIGYYEEHEVGALIPTKLNGWPYSWREITAIYDKIKVERKSNVSL